MANKKNNPPKNTDKNKKDKEQEEFPGYPEYPASEDIMNRDNRDNEVDLDMDEVTRSFRHNSEIPPKKGQKRPKGDEQEETWRNDKIGDDLDVPGSDLDDDDEAIGSEDEENNIYSIGGDRHEDLEETNDDLIEDEDDFEDEKY
ncbi:hypothetical protein SAMN05444266_105483 [Chitinophaga jiangningensis]|uniref:Uncharacterized protein n=1 Tax=Chitinophaga jiangningensis TaxID=1419482 RepID=A0A1M7EKS6_9BACT|nr:hypothetical protein [Chitinophaga jiangningensis]SHL92268.1 hypothetical protein SAMN05444266_105483 [Chitinophaga jiangningensis]